MDLDALKRDLMRDEGCRLGLYLDSKGIPTIGIGHNLRARGLSPAIVDAIYREDIDDVMRELDAHVPWWRTLDPIRQRVIANMGFNLGVDGDPKNLKDALTGFRIFLGQVEAGQYAEAARNMRATLWARQVGPRAERLAVMMETGKELAL